MAYIYNGNCYQPGLVLGSCHTSLSPPPPPSCYQPGLVLGSCHPSLSPLPHQAVISQASYLAHVTPHCHPSPTKLLSARPRTWLMSPLIVTPPPPSCYQPGLVLGSCHPSLSPVPHQAVISQASFLAHAGLLITHRCAYYMHYKCKGRIKHGYRGSPRTY